MTESCTSECDDNVSCNAPSRYSDAVPEKYKANYIKKLEAEAKDNTNGREEKGLLNAEESLTQSELVNENTVDANEASVVDNANPNKNE